MVPVGATTVACALRKPWFWPSAMALVPGALGGFDQCRVRAGRVVERHRRRRQLLVAVLLAVGGAAVIADDAQHVGGVGVIAGERPELARHFGRGGVGDAGHDRRDGAADGAARGRVIADAAGHQQAADVGEAEAERAVAVGKLGDLARRELRHQHRDLEHDRPQAAGVLEAGDVELARLLIAERHQVDGGEVARRVVEEHVLRARVRGADRAALRAGVPVVDGGVELDAGIGRGPRGVADLVPQLARLERLARLAVEAADQVPVAVLLDALRNSSVTRTELLEFWPETVR